MLIMFRSRTTVIVAILVLWAFIFCIPYIFNNVRPVQSNSDSQQRSLRKKIEKDASAGNDKNIEKMQENPNSTADQLSVKESKSEKKQSMQDQLPKNDDKDAQKLDEEINNGKPKIDGDIKQGKNCLDTLEHGKNGFVGVFSCHGLGRNQYWYLTVKNQLKNNNLCLEAKSDGDGSGPITLQDCDANKSRQHWEYEGESFILSGTKLCLDSENPNILSAKSCSQSGNQKWKFHQLKTLW